MTTLTDNDIPRLEKQMERVAALMADGQWRTLFQIAAKTGDPESSISARLRGLRAVGNTVERRRRGEPKWGLWEYRILPLGAVSRQMLDAALEPKPIQTVERWL